MRQNRGTKKSQSPENSGTGHHRWPIFAVCSYLIMTCVTTLASNVRKEREGNIRLFHFSRAVRGKPWIPQESAHARALGAWRVLRKPHKSPPNGDLAFQACVSYSLRFLLSGDLASDWETFGGIGIQFAHLGVWRWPKTLLSHNCTKLEYAPKQAGSRKSANGNLTLLNPYRMRNNESNTTSSANGGRGNIRSVYLETQQGS